MAIENNTDYTLKGSQVLALRDYVNAAMNLPGTVIGSGAPTTATEGNVGQFYYDTVNDKFYYCEAKTAQGTTPETYLYTWTLQVSGPTVVQTTGTSTTDVMSQNAVTSMVFADPASKEQVQIGANADTRGSEGISIGKNASIGVFSGSVAIGKGSTVSSQYSVALGYQATATRKGEVNIGSGAYSAYGYNSTPYRVLGGVHDPVDNHDAATKGYVDGLVGDIESALYDINNGGSN